MHCFDSKLLLRASAFDCRLLLYTCLPIFAWWRVVVHCFVLKQLLRASTFDDNLWPYTCFFVLTWRRVMLHWFVILHLMVACCHTHNYLFSLDKGSYSIVSTRSNCCVFLHLMVFVCKSCPFICYLSPLGVHFIMCWYFTECI